jgi:hypothetical protein
VVRDDLNFDPEFPRTDTTDSDTAVPGEDDENPMSGLWREDERGNEWWNVLGRPGAVARAERLVGRARTSLAGTTETAPGVPPAEPGQEAA